ncbi:hypothetical protein P154DRAFT_268601 [Amniculicola lignicola CBS 123094]|uniref:Uncharacterized protein n=1 Tax=Amniculicola lignicola CBS 123094 TaxID=1392246 RepID=A0A6A5W7V9_9PLEO|nr:hypothetical protein P154DRAFT_268601 [Amniculicola lignicola CBS 123094]
MKNMRSVSRKRRDTKGRDQWTGRDRKCLEGNKAQNARTARSRSRSRSRGDAFQTASSRVNTTSASPHVDA